MKHTLAEVPLLAGLTPGQLERVAARACLIELEEGAWLFTQGDVAERFYYVTHGMVRLFRSSEEGDEKIIEFAAPGQTFAEALMFLEEPYYPVCAAALEPSTLLAIDAPDFLAMVRDSPAACLTMLGNLSRRLRAMIAEVDTLTMHTAKRRLARYIAAACPADSSTLILPVRKHTLAARLSLQPESLSRAIKQLVDDGVIEVRGAHICVIERAELAEIGALDGSVELGLKTLFGYDRSD